MAFDYEYPQRLDLDTYDVFLEQSLNLNLVATLR